MLSSLGSIINSSKNSSIGIDIGTSSIKIVHLSGSTEKVVLENFVIARLKEGLIQNSNQIIAGKQIAQIIKVAMEKGGIKSGTISFSIPTFSSFSSFITLPRSDEENLASKVEIEARKYIPVPLSEVSLGWEIVPDNYKPRSMEIKSQEKIIKILLMAVSKDIIQKYEAIARSAGLNLGSMEVETFSLIRCLIGQDKTPSLIIDIGSRVSNLMIVTEGFLRGSSSIDVGGGEVTEAVARGMGVDFIRAEALKKEWGVDNPQVAELITPVILRIVQGIKKAIESYEKNNPSKKMEKIILIGGTSKMKGFKEYLKKELNLKIEDGNSLKLVSVEKLVEPLVQKFKDELAVAVGIALSGMENLQ
jgi:type IV pilus assembly protein PilM